MGPRLADGQDDRSRVTAAGVVDRVVAILDALEPGPAALSSLVAATGLPRATAHRLAVALGRHGLVSRDDEGRFVLGLRLIALGHAAADARPLRMLARQALEELRDQTGESVQLYVIEPGNGGQERRCILSLQSPHGLRWIVPEGALLPARPWLRRPRARGRCGRAGCGGLGGVGRGAGAGRGLGERAGPGARRRGPRRGERVRAGRAPQPPPRRALRTRRGGRGQGHRGPTFRRGVAGALTTGHERTGCPHGHHPRAGVLPAPPRLGSARPPLRHRPRPHLGAGGRGRPLRHRRAVRPAPRRVLHRHRPGGRGMGQPARAGPPQPPSAAGAAAGDGVRRPRRLTRLAAAPPGRRDRGRSGRRVAS